MVPPGAVDVYSAERTPVRGRGKPPNRGRRGVGRGTRAGYGENCTICTWIGSPPVSVRTVIWMVAPFCPFHVQ